MELSVAGDKSDPRCSSSASKVAVTAKNKDIIRPPNITSLRSLAELLTFKYLFSSSTKSNHQNLLPHDDARAAPRRSSFSSSAPFSAIVISNNEDLLIQILLFLPPKSLIRFQCVSKQWRGLISSPSFRRLHLHKNRTISSTAAEAGLFLYRRKYENFELNAIPLYHDSSTAMVMITLRFLNFLDMEGEILAFHSCNGLIFIEFHWNNELRRYYVYNPTTNQYRLIPQPNIDAESRTVTAVNIVFDPLKSDEYRLVCVLSKVVFQVRETKDYFFLVYSSEAGVWKECTDVDTEGAHYYHFNQGVYWNGTLYWKSSNRSLLCFDLELDCVRKMKITDQSSSPPPHTVVILYFGESGGNLHLIDQFEPQDSFIHIWELELELGLGRYHSRWLLKHRVDVGFLTARYPLIVNERFATHNGNQFLFKIPCFLVDKKESKAKIMISLRGKLIFYEINSGSTEELVEIEPANLEFLGHYMSVYSCKHAFKHFETLACV